jgi:hypothetical protein
MIISIKFRWGPVKNCTLQLERLDDNETLKVLKVSGLVGIEGKERNPLFNTQQWDEITNSIFGFSWRKYGKHRPFILRFGSKVEIPFTISHSALGPMYIICYTNDTLNAKAIDSLSFSSLPVECLGFL